MGRNILIGIIVLAIAAASCVALAIRNAAKEAEAAGIDQINITGAITVDRQKMMEGIQTNGRPDMDAMRKLMAEYPDLSLDELLVYAESSSVKDFYYSSSISLDAGDSLEAYSTESSADSSEDSGGFPGPGSFDNRQGGGVVIQGGTIGMMAMGDFTLTGYSAEQAMTKFVSGTATIVDGELFSFDSEELTCLISSELAAFNGLSVGDTITLANPNDAEETYEFTIVGIYTDSSSSQSSDQPRFSTAMDPANLICLSYQALEAITQNSASVATAGTDYMGNETSTAVRGQLASTFVFTNLEAYESFAIELAASGLGEYYTVTSADLNNYQSSLLPLQNLSQFATTLLVIVLAIGAVILVVINVFNIRERKYEVGVLTAIGIKKPKVALQFVAELACVTIVFIILGAGLGAALSVPVANELLTSQIEQVQAQADAQNTNFGRTTGGGPMGGGPVTTIGGPGGTMMSVFGDTAEVSYLDQINATINLPIIGQLILIGIILTIISSLAAVIFVLRYEPLKILANRT
ncbi:MAG: ABC transporter permease [Propionibacteriaceae bacterium]|jgi:putative ABC transport system permease protein|nr:ABC transporter permease [Propionibacteriaceae bacterium]